MKDKNTGKVTLTYDSSKVGVITRPGPEVSEVRWSDGKYQFIPNRHLVEKKHDPK